MNLELAEQRKQLRKLGNKAKKADSSPVLGNIKTVRLIYLSYGCSLENIDEIDTPYTGLLEDRAA